ncbi:MAG: TonB-dependent receptor [Steroidobacteraceae bacterium]
MSNSRRISAGAPLRGLALLVLTSQLALAADEPSTTQSASLEEIIVTAARRAESLEKVPISVMAFTQKTLDQNTVRTMDDIAKLTPGVFFSRASDASGSVANIAIRGISSDAGSGATGVYIDDVPIQSRASYSGVGSSVWPEIFDLERVEILRGPQGTLFGAGSEGGTVRLITPQPSADKFDAYARAEQSFTRGGDPSQEAGAAVNVPLVDGKLGMRLTLSYRHDGGFVNRVDYITGNVLQTGSNFADTSTARIAFVYKPNDALTITPSFYWQDQYVNDSSIFWLPLTNRGDDSFNRSSNIRNTSHDRFSLPSLKVEWAFPGAMLTSSTSFFDRNQPGIQDLAAFESYLWVGQPPPAGMYAPSYNDTHQRNFTQEFRLQSTNPDSRVSWLVGAFYQRARQHLHQRVQDTFLPGLFNQYAGDGPTFEEIFGGMYLGKYTVVIDPFDTVDKQLAAFAQADIKITDKLKATLGLRYAKIDSWADSFYAGPIVGPPQEAIGSTSEKPVTPKLGVSYQITEGTMVYASATKGYRAGGYNNPVPINCGDDLTNLGLTERPPVFTSDTLWSYEIGSKSRSFEDRLSIDASAYVIKWKNIQSTYNLPTCGFSVTINAGDATSRGFEFALQGRPVPSLDLGLSVGYVHAAYTKDAFLRPPLPGQDFKPAVADGDRIPVNPWSAAFQGQWSFPMFGHSSYFRLNYSHSAGLDQDLSVQNPRTAGYDPDIPGLPAMNDLSIKLGMRLGPVDAALFVNNLTDEHPFLNVNHAGRGVPLFTAATVRPRTIGVTATYRY